MSDYIGYNKSDLVNIKDNDVGTQLLDKLTRIKSDRRIKPLDMYDNVYYSHRLMYNGYNLQIGDCYFMIPPEFIMVNSESASQGIVTLRQENTQKAKSGYHKRTILIDLVFNGVNQLNGFKVAGPSESGYYYVDGLRQLLAQFKCTPFLPISNELINKTYGIFTVALQSITMTTVPGFPNVMQAQITLQEVCMFPYLEVPDFCFRHMIDWDLFRFYYQSFLTEDHKYKRLQSLPPNKEHNRFKMSILDTTVFADSKATEHNILEVVLDSVILKESGDTNYTPWIDSDSSDVVISSFQCGYSNILTNIQMADLSSPTVQFLGGMDTIYNITFETTDINVVQALEQCQVSNDLLIRTNPKIRSSIGFVKLESELVEFTGSLFVMIESVVTNTVPGFPGLYNVQMNCVAYDVAQSERESLHGFRPFDCNKTDCINNDFEPDHIHDEQAIDQSEEGWKRKIRQDAYAEWKLRTSIEVYPDLRLPTYQEVDDALERIQKFRDDNGLSPLPYKKYPTRPAAMLHGYSPKNKATFDYRDDDNTLIDILSIEREEYEGYVDPDFYVFYPTSYNSFLQDDKAYYDALSTPPQMSGYTKSKTKITFPAYVPGGVVNGSKANTFVELACSFIGCEYQWGEEGTTNGSNGRPQFDCSGLVTYCLRTMGVIPNDEAHRLTTSSIPDAHKEFFTKVAMSEMQRGDLLLNDHHVVIYEGNGSVVHAWGEKWGVVETSVEKAGPFTSCWRVKDFVVSSGTQQNIENSNINNADLTQDETAARVWSFFKSKGFSDFGIAGILGNMEAESGINSGNLENTYNKSLGYTDEAYTQAVDNGTYSREKFISDHKSKNCGAGYGLVQFTWYTYKAELYDKAKAQGKSISDVGLQLEVLYDLLSDSIINKLKNAKSVREASDIFLHEYEKPKNQSTAVEEKRASNGEKWYEKFKGSNGDSGGGGNTSKYNLTPAEFEEICRAVMGETVGETSTGEKAYAQLIYDRLTDSSGRFGKLSYILSKMESYTGDLNDTVEDVVKSVFCEAEKWSKYKVFYALSPDDPVVEIERYDDAHKRIGTADTHIYWGNKTASPSVKYTISESGGSANDAGETTDVDVDVFVIEDADYFAEPVVINTAYYQGYSNEVSENYRDQVNSTDNIFNSSFCDMHQYSCRGRLVKAFPTYLFCLLDDQAQWYDGKKLWTNYYTHQSVVDIQIHATNDMPIETATITVNNSYHNLDRTQGGLSAYSLKDDEDYNSFQRFIYQQTHMMPGLGPKLTSSLIKLHQVICAHAKLREGARVHLRMGYGSDPLSLAPVMNGHVSDVTIGDQIQLVITSDGHELVQHVTSAKEGDSNNGWLGIFGLGEKQESSNIIADIMCKRSGWLTYLAKGTFEMSKYSIEHYGLFRHQDILSVEIDTEGDEDSWIDGAIAGGAAGAVTGGTVSGWNPIGVLIGTVVGAIGGGLADEYVEVESDINLNDLVDEWAEQYDICKNIYRASYRCILYCGNDIDGTLGDTEQNIVFTNFNMTPWDMFQMCTQQVPEYILKSTYHQFDSRLYFGLPFWMEKYRYDVLYDGENEMIVEECKTASQVHFLDSMDNIIDNQIRVTSKYSSTNIKVMYLRGGSAVSTMTIHSDDSIDMSRQKTRILDTPIVQDALGPDLIYEIVGYDVGDSSARRVGISNLLYGWQQQYQGQIILLGSPGIKPHDYLMINDAFLNLFGVAIVREVVHSFNTNTGFTTSVTPGLNGFSTDENSGCIEATKNFLSLLSCFSSYTFTRRGMYQNYEATLGVWGDAATLMELANSRFQAIAFWQGLNAVQDVVSGAVDLAVLTSMSYHAFSGCYKLFKTAKTIKSLDAFGDAAKATWTTIKGVRNTLKFIRDGKKAASFVKGLSNLKTAITTGTVVLAPETGGTSLIVGAVINAALWLIFDVILDSALEWFSNKNTCVLCPLWWENYPFVAGVKDGEKILLIPADARATDENTGEDAWAVIEEE